MSRYIYQISTQREERGDLELRESRTRLESAKLLAEKRYVGGMHSVYIDKEDDNGTVNKWYWLKDDRRWLEIGG